METGKVGRLKEKQAFYAGLEGALAESSTDEEDVGRQASVRAPNRLTRNENTATPGSNAGHSHGLSRSASETNLAGHNARNVNDQVQTARPKTSSGEAPPTLTKSATIAGMPDKTTLPSAPPTAIPRLKSSGKRKRDGTVDLQLVPEAQRIFKGLHFYFFPNNDVNPARAMRIMKTIEFGATWQAEWNDCVTHVIIDNKFDYGQLLKHLKVQKLSNDAAVVSETYPSDCLTFRTVLEPRQSRFHVKGYVAPEKPTPSAEAPPAFSAGSEKSLQLKPAGKSVKARQSETPKTTDEPATSQLVALSPVEQEDVEQRQQEAVSNPRAVEQASATAQAESTAEFDAAIRQAKELQYVPLEGDEGADSRPTSSGGPATDDEAQETPKPGLQLLKQRKSKYQTMQDKFQCMQKHTGEANNPNAATIAILQQMATYYDQMGDEWRTRAYRKAISTLRNHPTKVWTKEEAAALPQIGDRLATKIEEIAFTNRLRRLDEAKAEPTDQVLQTFMGVYGAGFSKASEWVGKGYKTLDELFEKADLTDNQRIGVEHYVDFNSRIPRAEVEQHGAVVRKALHRIDSAFEVIVGGSYRRGEKTSGDIDCIITSPNTSSAHLRAVILEQLVPTLIRQNFLVASLATTNRDDGSKWHGASCLPSSKTWRRLDLLLVPSDEIGAALIYFTGNDIFNRSLRLLASTKGMRLNQRGLYKDCLRGKGREKLSVGTLVEGEREKRIFEVLGVPWRPPEHRIC